MRKVVPAVYLGAFLLFGSPGGLVAQGKVALLQKGATHEDVIKLLGAPSDREERETKREEVWIYDAAEVVFYEGKVSSWQDMKVDSAKNGAATGPSDQAAVIPSSPKLGPVEDIISEILKEVPTDNSPSQPAPPVQNQIQAGPNDPRPLDVVQ